MGRRHCCCCNNCQNGNRSAELSVTISGVVNGGTYTCCSDFNNTFILKAPGIGYETTASCEWQHSVTPSECAGFAQVLAGVDFNGYYVGHYGLWVELFILPLETPQALYTKDLGATAPDCLGFNSLVVPLNNAGGNCNFAASQATVTAE